MKFSDALDRKQEEISRPPVLPLGHYIWQITKHPEIDEFTSRNGDDFERITFMVQCVSATDDVDPDQLAEYGSVSGAMNRKTFMFNNDPEKKADFENSMFNVGRFLEHCGVNQEGTTMADWLAESVNMQFIGELKHRPDPEDPEVIWTEIGKTAPV